MTNDTQTTREHIKHFVARYPTDGGARVADAILAEFVVIPRSELPAVVDDGRSLVVAGVRCSYDPTAEDRRADALMHLAVAEHLEREEAEQAAHIAKRNARRDEIARELCAPYGERREEKYSDLAGTTQAAIDRIIELEEAAA